MEEKTSTTACCPLPNGTSHKSIQSLRACLALLAWWLWLKTHFDASANWSIYIAAALLYKFLHSKCSAPHFDPSCPFLHESTPTAPIGPADTILSFQCFLSLGEAILPVIPGLGQGGAARISLDCSSSKIYLIIDILSLIQSRFPSCLSLGLGPHRCHMKSRKYSVSLVEWFCWSLTT